jgi:hypothetical protein
MRTFLAVVGALFLLFILALVGVFIVGSQRMKPLQKEAVAYIDEILPEILSGWRGEALLAEAAPELRAELTADRLEELMMNGLAELGPMTAYLGGDCKILRVEFSSASGESAEAACAAGASFARAEAAITVGAAKRGGDWKLISFYVQRSGAEAPVQIAHHTGSDLGVFEASLSEGFVAISASGRK